MSKLTNEEFLQRLKDKEIKYIQLEEYKGMSTKIKWLCPEHPLHIFDAKPSHIFDGHGCPYCYGRIPTRGINDLWTTHPEIAKMLKNQNEGFEYSSGSHHKTDWKCLNCGTEVKGKTIKSVVGQGLACPFCSDSMSYSEKFIYEMLEQLNVDFIFNRTREWSGLKKYDFYIPNLSLIIEANGIQHYDDFNLRNYYNRVRSLDEEKENDVYKMTLAFENGIKEYIVLDCRKSNLEYIKNSILESELDNIFDLSNIDWNKCHIATFSSITMDICNLWNNGLHYIQKIADTVGVNHTTVIHKLKLCSEQGLCDYKSGDSNGRILYEAKNKKKVLCVETGKIYESISSVKNDGYSPQQVSKCCNGTHDTHKGFHWEFI